MNSYKNIAEALEQLKKCNYECQGGPLEKNTAFEYLEQLSDRYPLLLGDEVETEIEGELQGVKVTGKTIGYVHKLTYRYNQLDGNETSCYKVWADIYKDKTPHRNNNHLKTILLWNEHNDKGWKKND